MKVIYRKDVSCVIGYIMLLASVHATLTEKPEDSIICPNSKETFLSCTTDDVGLQIKFRPSSPPNADFRFAYIDASSVTGFSASASSNDTAAELTINTPSSDFAGTYTCEDIGGTGDKAEAKVIFIQSNNCSIESDKQEKTKSKVCCVVKYAGGNVGIVPNAYLKSKHIKTDKDNCLRLTDSQTVEGGIKVCGSIQLTDDPVDYSAFLSASTSGCPVPKEQIENCNWKEYKSVSLHKPQEPAEVEPKSKQDSKDAEEKDVGDKNKGGKGKKGKKGKKDKQVSDNVETEADEEQEADPESVPDKPGVAPRAGGDGGETMTGSSADKTKGSIIGGMIFIYLFTAALFY